MSRKPGATTSLSNGTLSLRFMQRGATQRVAAASAKVADEAEWDIGSAARAAWGVASAGASGSATQSSSIRVLRDNSYLPFVFDHNSQDSTGQQLPTADPEVAPARRRVFKHGAEVAREAPVPQEPNMTEEPDKTESTAGSDVKAGGPSSPIRAQAKSASDSKQSRTSSAHVVNKPGARRHKLEELFRPPNASTPVSGFLKPSGVSSASSTSTKRINDDEMNSRSKVMRTK